MAFHVSCPITCQRICFCNLGFPSPLATSTAKHAFFSQIRKLQDFLQDPWRIRVCHLDKETAIQVSVPKIAFSPTPPATNQAAPPVRDSAEDEAAAAASAQAKRVALQRKAAAAMVAAEDFARRFESGDLVDCTGGVAREEQGQTNVNVMCRLCFFGENEESERAKKMLSCKSCGKKYHRNCLKNWAQHRDLFHWSSWACPSCRICEVCRRTGDPNKFMFCKRCDGAYHCYCQHPSHKNVSSGPYLCPKHTRCHSCDSAVPGNGLSVRWFLGYTCCDACGRLFVKGNYCPVCLKVYRDSESTPMVCCDLCQRWVHCQCDDISDEKYMQYQVDANLQYKCSTCRGESYQVTNLEDAVKELWRRKDEVDRDLITSLRAAAGLPTQDEIFSISPYSDDDEENPSSVKSEYGRSLKLSLKGLADKSPKKGKDHGKKYSSKASNKKKGYQASVKFDPGSEAHNDGQSFGYTSGHDGFQSQKDEVPDTYSSPVTESLNHIDEIRSINNKNGALKQKFVNEVMASDEDRTSRIVRIKNDKSNDMDSGDDTGRFREKSTVVKGKKLVINLGARKINVASSPMSDGLTIQRDQELLASNGGEHASWRRTNEKPTADRRDPTNGDVRNDHASQTKGLKVGSIKLGRIRTSDQNSKHETITPEPARNSQVKQSLDGEIRAPRTEKVYVRKQSENKLGTHTASKEAYAQTPVSESLPKDAKPLLRLKFKKPSHIDNQNSVSREEERSSIKGQRSKRKRPSLEKLSMVGADVMQVSQDNVADEIMDANWILKKLGKDAVGKAVEVHQPSDNSWHKGVVANVADGTSTVTVRLDDGKVKYIDLSKQGVRFVSHKPKRSKTSLL